MHTDSISEFRVFIDSQKAVSRFFRDTFSNLPNQWRFVKSDRYGNEIHNFSIMQETAELAYNHARTVAWKMPNEISIEVTPFSCTRSFQEKLNK